MKELEGEHFTNSIIYLIEQISIYCKTKGSQLFESSDNGLTMDQYTILDTIDGSPEICQMDLAKLILKGRSYTSRLLISLEENGFLERKVETKGKRLIRKLYLTQKGKQTVSENQIKLKKVFTEVLKDFSDEDYKQTRKGLEKMKECISKYTIIPL
jgi:DNA-binding MarR family transcriptional regulator